MDDLEWLCRQGWPLLKIHRFESNECSCGKESCKDKGKHPDEIHGVHSADVGHSPEYFTNRNVGVACGNGLVVIDIDPRNGGLDTYKKLQQEFGFAKTLTCKTGGGGFHLYYKVECEVFKTNLGVGIDFQSSGKYVLAPPSLHPNGNLYEWDSLEVPLAPLPQWIVDKSKKENDGLYTQETLITPEDFLSLYDDKDIADALNYIPANDRELWVMCAMGLKWSALPNAFNIFNEWSKLGGDKYKGEKDCLKTWNSIKQYGDKSTVTLRSLLHEATIRGWEYKGFTMELCSELMQDLIIKKSNNLELPNNNFGRLVRWFLNNASYPYPSFAVASAFACYSAVAQGTYKTPTNRHLNLYQLLINSPASGKEFYYLGVQRILEAIKSPRIGAESQSCQGLRRELLEYSSRIAIIDEYLMLLESFAKSPAIGQAILRDILQLWSSSSLNSLRTKELSTSIPKVKNASYSLFGTGTTKSLRKLLNTPMFVELGLLSRFVMFKANFPEKLTHNFPAKDVLPPDEILEELASIQRKTKTILIEHPSNEKFITKKGEEKEKAPTFGVEVIPSIEVIFDPSAQEKWQKYREEMHTLNLKEPVEMLDEGSGIVSVRNRSSEFILRYASLVAISNNINTPMVTVAELDFAESIIAPMIQNVKKEVSENVYTNDVDKVRKKILAYMLKSKEEGRIEVPRRLILQFCNISKRDFDLANDDWGGLLQLPEAKCGNRVIFTLNKTL